MMEGWESHKIKDLDIKLIDGDRGKQYPKKKEFLDEGYCLFLNTSNVRKDGFDFNKTSFITKEKDELLRKGKLSRHDIILTTRGTIGNIAIYNDNVPFENIRINSGMLIIRANKQQFNNSYLFQYFKSSLFQEQVKLFQYGAAQPQLPVGTLNHIKVVVPPLKTQRKIASILSGYDDLIENNLKRIKLLEEQAQQTYEEWFVRFKFPGSKNVEIDAESGLPVGWEKDYFKGNLNFKTGKLDSNALVEDGIFDFYTCAKQVYKTDTFCFEGEAVLLGGNNATGDFALFYANNKFDAYQRTYIVTSENKTIPLVYVFYYLQKLLPYFQVVSSGASTKFLTMKILNKTKILIPNKEILLEFENLIKPCFDSILLLQKQNQHLKEARDILLPRLMSGMIDVDGLEVDEQLGMVAEEREKYN